MGFSLGSIAAPLSGLASNIAGQVGNTWFNGLYGSQPGAPTLPNAPSLNAPQLPQFPGFSPEEQATLQKYAGLLQQMQGTVGSYGQNPYSQQSDQVSQAELGRYQQALNGSLPLPTSVQQQKQREWEQLKEQAGQQGIRLSGDNPNSAASESTAGNQMIMDFNKRYDALQNDIQNQAIQAGYQQNTGRLGLYNQNFNTQLGGLSQMGNMYANYMDPYSQQRLGQFGVATNQATSNADIANQNLMNQYGASTNQAMLGYQNSMNNYNQRVGFINNMIGAGTQMATAGMTGGASMAGGSNYIPMSRGMGQMGLNQNNRPSNGYGAY